MLSSLGDALVVWTAIYAVAAVATAVVLGVASGLAIWQIREVAKTRHAALMADLSRRWDEELLAKSREQAAKYGRKGSELRDRIAELEEQKTEEYFVLHRIPNYFEDLGVLQTFGAIPLDMIVGSLGLTVVETWAKWEETVHFLRQKFDDEKVYEHFEKLANRIQDALADP